VLQGMLGLDGVALPAGVMNRLGPLAESLQALGVRADLMASGTAFVQAMLWVAGLLAVALLLPNSLELMRHFEPAHNYRAAAATAGAAPGAVGGGMALTLKPHWALLIGSFLVLGVFSLNRVSEFLYWQF
jgi:alginate O-acetyltransferase complex protein AlgI